MRKNKKYISDVKNKIVEHPKIESGCKKRAKALKIPISTIRVIIKRFQSTKDKSAWKRTCVYIVLMHAEEESLSDQRLSKDHSWRIAEISWVLGSETWKNIYQTAPTSPHVVREGFKKNCPYSSKNKLQQIQLSDTTRTSNGTGFYGQMKLKK